MNIKLYHGTSSRRVNKIMENGLKMPYLTSSYDQAMYYAEELSGEDESFPIILIVSVDTEQLQADLPSFNEPLSYILEEHDLDEEEWHQAITNEEIPYPNLNDWKTSLEYVFCVKSKEDILSKKIIFDQNYKLSQEDLKNIKLAN